MSADAKGKFHLTEYVPSLVHDAILFKWFTDLIQRDEFEETFYRQPMSLSKFFEMFAPPTRLFFKVDSSANLIFAAWGDPFVNSTTYAIYAHRSVRTVKSGLIFVEESHNRLFEKTSLILAITRYPKVVDQLQRLGYNRVGQIPVLYGGVTLLSLTIEDWQHRTIYSIERSPEWLVEGAVKVAEVL